MLGRLRELWEGHLAEPWSKALPMISQNLSVIHHHFAAGSPDEVFHHVTGRPQPELISAKMERVTRVIFHPIPFLVVLTPFWAIEGRSSDLMCDGSRNKIKEADRTGDLLLSVSRQHR